VCATIDVGASAAPHKGGATGSSLDPKLLGATRLASRCTSSKGGSAASLPRHGYRMVANWFPDRPGSCSRPSLVGGTMNRTDRYLNYAISIFTTTLLLAACDGTSRSAPVDDGPMPSSPSNNRADRVADSDADARASGGAPSVPSETRVPAADASPPESERDPHAAPSDPPKSEPDPGTPEDSTPESDASTSPQPSAAIDHHSDIRGLCELHTQFPDDHACIPAPPAGEGMQIHVGPSNYDNAAEVAKYILRPGEETSDCFAVVTPNDTPVYFQTSMLSGRAGTHHIINTLFPAPADGDAPSSCTEDGLSSPNKIGALPGASKPYMPRSTVAPEYAHVGNSIPAHAKIEAELHYFNATDKDILREFWLNIYFVKPEAITEQATGIAALGGFTWNITPIPPGTDKVYRYSCPVRGEGYILSLLGHYHAHGKRFTASISRASGTTEKVFEMYDYRDPAEFQYNSVVTNPMFSTTTPGAISGRLAVHDGDVINWECHIVNDSSVGLTYTNAVQTGEMCNLWGNSIGVDPIVCAL
jgi:hypothetical protein